jgi:DNA-directed RNA polymerase omega subunit
MIHLPQNMSSKYRFITLAAQRCNQLMRGARPRVETRSKKATTIAQEEVLAGLIGEGRADVSETGLEELAEALLSEPLPVVES